MTYCNTYFMVVAFNLHACIMRVEEYKGYGENRWFFFAVRGQSSSNKEKEPSRKVRVKGVTATWKATGSVQLIRRARSKDGDGNNKVVVGTKRVLIYNSSDTAENGKWSMHEYILKDHAAVRNARLIACVIIAYI